jgi:hypothetical protein
VGEREAGYGAGWKQKDKLIENGSGGLAALWCLSCVGGNGAETMASGEEEGVHVLCFTTTPNDRN